LLQVLVDAFRGLSRTRAAAVAVLLSLASLGGAAQEPVATPPARLLTVLESSHARLVFADEVVRFAVGNPDIAAPELVTSREVLVLGGQRGRTSLFLWFDDGRLLQYQVVVQRDLTALQSALRGIHPGITVEIAPDRDAVMLTGTVPNAAASQAAERVARAYLQSSGSGSAAVPEVTIAPGGGDVAAGLAALAVGAQPAQAQAGGEVINLLRLETLSPLPEDRVVEAIRSLGGDHVTIRRVQRGALRNDGEDLFILEGTVPNQIALVRVLNVASQVLTGGAVTGENIRVVADEAGGLYDAQGGQGGQGQGRGGSSGGQGGFGGTGGGAGGIFGGGGDQDLTNQVTRNIGRAKVLEAAGGRILSFIQVADLPQVRVNVRIFQVNRTRLRNYTPSTTVLTSSLDESLPNSAGAGGAGNASVGIGSDQIRNVLSFLSGLFVDQLQFSVGRGVVDAAFAMLERDGIAQGLSSPSLTVLNGEPAVFQVGGEVPVTNAFSPAFGGNTGTTPGVFSTVQFIPFGVALQVRPLVGEDDVITLDVFPRVTTPDATLTESIRQTSGTSGATTAFSTRSLRTSARLQDGQTLLVGGLTSSNLSDSRSRVPLLSRVPGLGSLFRGSAQNEDELELVIVVNPTIVRDPLVDAALWVFPPAIDLPLPLVRQVALYAPTATSPWAYPVATSGAGEPSSGVEAIAATPNPEHAKGSFAAYLAAIARAR